MPLRKDPTRGQFDLFVPYLTDLPLRDQKDTMERPFFSLAKRKRLKPIDYTSPDGSVWIKVEGHQAYGMATIWDADILIWAASTLMEMKERGINDLPRTLHFHPHNLLKAIKRDTKGNVAGSRYDQLRAAMNRLNHTAIQTNIRAKGRKKTASFHWIDTWREEIDEATGDTKGMSLTLSDWMYQGIMESDVLSLHPDYFLLTGGLERVLYRIFRKHAGRQDHGWTVTLKTLFVKTGSDDEFRNFKVAVKRIVQANELPEYWLRWIDETESGEPAVHAIRRSKLPGNHPGFAFTPPKARTRSRVQAF